MLDTLIASKACSAGHVFDCLLSFALHDFTPLGLFAEITPGMDELAIDGSIGKVEIKLSMLHNPIGIVCMMELLYLASDSLHYGVSKMVDRIAFASHRNQALLSQSGLTSVLLAITGSTTLPHSSISIAQKSSKRLLEMGAPLDEARKLLQSTIKISNAETTTYSLDSQVLDRLRDGMKTAGKWPNFVSIGGGDVERSGLELGEAQLQGRTFPGSAGFSFLVRCRPPLMVPRLLIGF